MFFGGGFPFADMGGMGGGGMGRPQKDVDTSRYYNLLGIEKNADANTIRKAYRKLALQHHPDRGGDAEKFKEISQAYEVLNDDEKRKIYDQYGEEGLENGGGGGGDMGDIFAQMFGGGGGGRPQRRRGQDMIHKVNITLEQLYNGVTKKMALSKDVLCGGCNGKGADESKIKHCNACDGRGKRQVIRRMGPMIQQQVVPCTDCNGKGKSVDEKDKCKQCHGGCTIKEKKVLEVFVEKGSPNNHKIVFSGEADQAPGEEAGDVIFIVQEQEHATFKRFGTHLVINKKITLLEALTGFQFMITHLDGRKILIKSPEGKVVKPGDQLMVRDEGMPTHKQQFVRGNLIVKIDVEFPKTVDAKMTTELKKVLPNPPALKLPTDHAEYEEAFLQDASHFDQNADHRAGASGDAYDEDDDEGHHGHGHPGGVECRQG